MTRFFLTIDGGNTLTKYALFDGKHSLIDKTEVDCASLIEGHGLTPENTLCAQVNVARPRAQLQDFIIHDVADHFKNKSFLDMPVDYSETLGLDRLIYAYEAFDGQSSTALVDSGTFTTVDFVDQTGFRGGHILPGLEFLVDAYDFGYLLKSMAPKEILAKNVTLPKDSETAMASGLTHSFIAPIDAILKELSFDQLKITGGNGKVLKEHLKDAIFQRSASILLDSDLVHKGLLKFLTKVTGI